MKKSKLIRYIVIPLSAILIFWLGGYLYFKGSSDWQDIQTLIADNPDIRAQVGEIKEISVGVFPFMYRFSGDQAQATLRVKVVGAAGVYRGTISAKRRNGIWSLNSLASNPLPYYDLAAFAVNGTGEHGPEIAKNEFRR